jgi:ribosomal protein L37AE/L43A
MTPPCKYDNDEDRLKAHKAQQNKYSMQYWVCEVCDCVMRIGNKKNHLNSQKHFDRASGIFVKVREDKIWKCAACDIEIHVHSKDNHLKSARHIRNSNKLNISENELANDENFKENIN